MTVDLSNYESGTYLFTTVSFLESYADTELAFVSVSKEYGAAVLWSLRESSISDFVLTFKNGAAWSHANVIRLSDN